MPVCVFVQEAEQAQPQEEDSNPWAHCMVVWGNLLYEQSQFRCTHLQPAHGAMIHPYWLISTEFAVASGACVQMCSYEFSLLP